MSMLLTRSADGRSNMSIALMPMNGTMRPPSP